MASNSTGLHLGMNVARAPDLEPREAEQCNEAAASNRPLPGFHPHRNRGSVEVNTLILAKEPAMTLRPLAGTVALVPGPAGPMAMAWSAART